MNKKDLLVLSFCIFAIVFRLFPHPPNFTPITSLAIFGGFYFTNKWVKMLLPICLMFISDLVLGFSWITPWVYISFMLISLISMYVSEINSKVVFISSVMFFIITNFGVWILGYPQTVEGLLMCYTLAIPFFVNSLLGDFFFSYLLKHTFQFTENKVFKYNIGR